MLKKNKKEGTMKLWRVKSEKTCDQKDELYW